MKILLVIMSCYKHSHLWDNIKKNMNDNLIIFIGGATETYYNDDKKILHLACNDFYEGLPEKILYTINKILELEQFNDITHILKIDDHDNKFTKEAIDNLYQIEDLNNYDYIGQRVHDHPGQTTFHFNKVTKYSYWDDRKYEGEYVPFLDGGTTYILSRKAMTIINEEFKIIGINTIRRDEIYEDVMIAKILHKHNILPKVIHYGIIGDKSL